MFTVTFSSRFPKEFASRQYVDDFRKHDAVYEFKLMPFLKHQLTSLRRSSKYCGFDRWL